MRVLPKAFLSAAVLWMLGCSDLAYAAPGDGSLYVVTGTIGLGANWPVSYLRINIDTGESSLVNQLPFGLGCVFVDQDRRRLIVGSPALVPTQFTVIEMHHPTELKMFQVSYDTRLFVPSPYLMDLPSQGEVVAIRLDSVNRKAASKGKGSGTDLLVKSIGDLDAATLRMPIDNIRYIRLSGLVGGALPDDYRSVWVTGNPLRILFPGRPGWDTGIAAPPYLVASKTQPSPEIATLIVNNDAAAVLSGPRGSIDVLNKTNQEWRRIMLPFTSYRIRVFGNWLAGIAEGTIRCTAWTDGHG